MNDMYEQFKRDIWIAIKKRVKGNVYVQYQEKNDLLYIKATNHDFTYDWKLKNFMEHLSSGITKDDVCRMFMRGYSTRIDIISKRRYLKFQRNNHSRK